MSQKPVDITEQIVPSDNEFLIVLVGESTTSEFDAVADELLSAIPDATFRVVRDLAQLSTDLQDEGVPDLIIFVLTWPDEFRFSELIALPWIGPLTQVLCVYGAWCVSDGRSRQDWPLALRIPLEHLSAEVLAAFARNANSGPVARVRGRADSTSTIPWTAGRDEVFAARYAFDLPQSLVETAPVQTTRRVRISSPDLAQAQFWRDLAILGAYQIQHQTNAPADLLLWDGDPFGSSRSNSELLETWANLTNDRSDTKIVVLTGFQTSAMVARYQSLGASAVISKLLPISALMGRLNRIWEVV
jgi:hypothetical protein